MNSPKEISDVNLVLQHSQHTKQILSYFTEVCTSHLTMLIPIIIALKSITFRNPTTWGTLECQWSARMAHIMCRRSFFLLFTPCLPPAPPSTSARQSSYPTMGEMISSRPSHCRSSMAGGVCKMGKIKCMSRSDYMASQCLKTALPLMVAWGLDPRNLDILSPPSSQESLSRGDR